MLLSIEDARRRLSGYIGSENETTIERLKGTSSYRFLVWMIPIRDYILAAESQIAIKDSALSKINDIRNSIIGFQRVGWSEHIYPLVAALKAAGYDGLSYEKAADDAQALLDQIAERDAKLQAANARVSELFDEIGIVQNEAATQRGELERQIAERDAQIAEMRKVTLDALNTYGGHLNAPEDGNGADDCWGDPNCKCGLTAMREKLAAELGLEANDAVRV